MEPRLYMHNKGQVPLRYPARELDSVMEFGLSRHDFEVLYCLMYWPFYTNQLQFPCFAFYCTSFM